MTHDSPSSRPVPVLSGSRATILICLFTIGILYGLTFSLTRIGTTEGIPFTAFIFWQFAGGSTILVAASLLFRQRPSFRPDHLWRYTITALCGVVVPFGVFAFVAPKLPAGIVSLAISLAPTLTLLIALALRLERFNSWRLAGILFGVGGVLLIVLPDTSLPDPAMARWVLLSLLGALALAGVNICSLVLRPAGSSSLQFGTGVQVAGAAMLLPLMLGLKGWWLFDGPLGEEHVALVAGMVIVAGIWWLSLELVLLAGPVFMSLFDNVATLAGVAWGILIFSESHSAWVWGALALLLLGVYLVNRTSPPARR